MGRAGVIFMVSASVWQLPYFSADTGAVHSDPLWCRFFTYRPLLFTLRRKTNSTGQVSACRVGVCPVSQTDSTSANNQSC